MRGTGKFVGELAASSLGWCFLDADHYFEEKLKLGVREYVHQKGWEAFREAELQILKELVAEKSSGYIISLGGGIVETPTAREVLKKYAAEQGPVVFDARPIEEIIMYLNAETARPAYEEPIINVFRRREPWFTDLPIVFTVRTKGQGGAFPDNAQKEALALLNAGLRLGVEYLDVEISLPEEVKALVSRKGYSQVIASWHDWSGAMKWNGATVKEKYDDASRIGDIVKIVGKAETLQDNFALYDFAANAAKQIGAKPLITINMGGEGQMSPFVQADPTGTASSRAVPRSPFLPLGHPHLTLHVPTLHNTGFELLGLPYHYELLETKDVGEEIKLALASPDFGGASVTIPYKLDIIPLFDKLTPAAEAIGAVNTVIPQAVSADSGSGRILVGDNTDWLGIKASITQRLSPLEIHAGLAIGAGGTARAAIYALQNLGVKTIYLHNRTKSKAEALAAVFPDAGVEVVEKLKWADSSVAPNAGALALPESVFAYRTGPAVVVDMAYKPEETPLLALAKDVGANCGVGWPHSREEREEEERIE
ncbi:hypothetical protein D9611_011431 [Ephemerocybe angulata]|uniref:shikimate kinase n=1 Tax=Ephemerocybe angulata TaxID=980116 RepID=A0A8H5FJZ9_9AGAR|nr:hypothetical protein D9611_011431 [Tulosesus angulatus]